MSPITHIDIPIELFILPLKGRYEMSIVALAYNFNGKGLTMSNGKLAKVLRTSSRTIERVISKLRTKGIVEDSGTGKNDRCLRLSTDAMSVVSTGITSGVDTDTTSGGVPTLGVVTTDVTADHNKKGKEDSLTALVGNNNSSVFDELLDTQGEKGFHDHGAEADLIPDPSPEKIAKWEKILNDS